MLQQTQVSRVVPKYSQWVKRWSNWAALAGAARRDVLQLWSGLGYNRRALFLHELANTLVSDYGGKLPLDREELKKLPGIGEYTSAAILIFAHNADYVAVDTNIRQVLITEFNLSDEITNSALRKIAERAAPRGRSRDWHYALMDYAALGLDTEQKRKISKPRQSQFEGSIRQIRGAIVRQLTVSQRVTIKRVAENLGRTAAETKKAAESLAADGMIRIRANTLTLTD